MFCIHFFVSYVLYLFPVADFEYIVHNVTGEGVHEEVLEVTFDGCDCDGECTAAASCSCLIGGKDNYDDGGRLLDGRHSSEIPLLECHENCACVALGCTNRVVQKGVKAKIRVSPSGEKGFGLFTEDDLPKGTFLCEYVGELLGADEVEKRKSTHNYVLTVKEHVQVWYIDPSRKGNIARFINHSCEPNLNIAIVRVGQTSPCVGLFCARDIEAGEELCYDYGSSGMGDLPSTRKCLCGATNCRIYLPMSLTASE